MIWLFLCLVISGIVAWRLAHYYARWILVFGEWHHFKRLPKLDMNAIEANDPFTHAVLTAQIIAEKMWTGCVNVMTPKSLLSRMVIGDFLQKQAQKGSWKQDLSGVKLRRPNQ